MPLLLSHRTTKTPKGLGRQEEKQDRYQGQKNSKEPKMTKKMGKKRREKTYEMLGL